MISSTTKLSILPLLVVAVVVTAVVGAEVETRHSSHRRHHFVDLSFLHRVKSSTLADAIRQTTTTTTTTIDDDIDIIDIDISSSLIGKDIKDILPPLKDATTKIHKLIARSNHWSQRDVTMLLNAVTDSSSSSNNKEEQTMEENSESIENTTNKTNNNNNISPYSSIFIDYLDLAWNDLSQENRDSKIFYKALQKLIKESTTTTTTTTTTTEEGFTLRLDVCGLGPAACRALGKGIIERYENMNDNNNNDNNDIDSANVDGGSIQPLSLHLTRNENIGDSGTAALAAAIRSVCTKNEGGGDVTVFNVLDLSGCGISDTGAEALALALENHPLCIRDLILSNNKITDEGATVLGRALGSSKLQTLDLSNNKGIGNSGAIAMADIIEKGTVTNIILRSCNIQADGMSSIAKAIKKKKTYLGSNVVVDLSGNPLGILRKKTKSTGYSATALKSKATKTTAAYMSFIGKKVQKGLKDFGLTEGAMGSSTLESDDEEEANMDEDDKSSDEAETKCGALAFADAFIDVEDSSDSDDDDEDEIKNNQESTESTRITDNNENTCEIKLGLRHCSFDTRAAEAFAAVIQAGKQNMGMNINIDITMNDVLEDDMVEALGGNQKFQSYLSDMADNYLEVMEALRHARKRALEASKAAAARMKAEAELEAQWGAAPMGDDQYDDEDRWDSDADYDDDEQDTDGYF